MRPSFLLPRKLISDTTAFLLTTFGSCRPVWRLISNLVSASTLSVTSGRAGLMFPCILSWWNRRCTTRASYSPHQDSYRICCSRYYLGRSRAWLSWPQSRGLHVEIRELVVTTFTKMCKPAPTSNPTVRALEAFSTALGITTCAKKTSHIQ